MLRGTLVLWVVRVLKKVVMVGFLLFVLLWFL